MNLKLNNHLVYIENKLTEYNKALETADNDNKQIIQAEIDKQNNRKDFYHNLSKEL